MQLFEGLDQTDYQDVLRAIGLLVDQHDLRDVRVIEIERGLIIQGLPRKLDRETRMFSEVLDETAVREILREAYARRQPSPPPRPVPPLLPLPVGEVRVNATRTLMEVTLRDVGVEPVWGLTLSAQWHERVFRGAGAQIVPGGELAVQLRLDPDAAPDPVVLNEATLRLWLRFHDAESRLYAMRARYVRGSGWRVEQLPTALPAEGRPVPG